MNIFSSEWNGTKIGLTGFAPIFLLSINTELYYAYCKQMFPCRYIRVWERGHIYTVYKTLSSMSLRDILNHPYSNHKGMHAIVVGTWMFKYVPYAVYFNHHSFQARKSDNIIHILWDLIKYLCLTRITVMLIIEVQGLESNWSKSHNYYVNELSPATGVKLGK